MGWLTGWKYRKKITLSRASGTVSNYQMRILVGESAGATGEDVDCAAKCKTDFTDLRFTTSDGTTLLNYFIENISGTTPNQLAAIWIKFDSIGTTDTTFYMYYGNTSASNVISLVNTVDNYENFEDGTMGKFTGVVGSAYWAASQLFAKEGTYSARCNDTSGSSNAGRYTPQNTFWNADNKKIALWILANSGNGVWTYLVRTTTLRITAIIEIPTFTAGGSLIASGLSRDVWYQTLFYLRYGSTVFDVEIRDANYTLLGSATNIAFNYNAGASYRDLLLVSAAAAIGINYVDQVFSLQYVVPEPVWGSWGRQQILTAPLPISFNS